MSPDSAAGLESRAPVAVSDRDTYLDTSAYNALADDPDRARLLAAVSRRAAVRLSFHGLAELTGTAGSRKGGRRRAVVLLDLARATMGGRELLAHPSVIFERELRLRQTASVVLNYGLEPQVFAADLEGDWLAERTAADLAGARAWKAKVRRDQSDWQHRGWAALGWKAPPRQPPVTVEQMLVRTFDSVERLQALFVEDLEAAGASIAQIGDLATTIRGSISWYPFLVAEVVRRYRRLTGQRSCDLSDTMHAAYLPCVRAFVTADEGQRLVFAEAARFCYPLVPRRILSWEDWRAELLGPGPGPLRHSR